MKSVDPSGNIAAVLHLRRVEHMSARRIAFHLHLSCKTVREILARHQAPAKPSMPRGSFLDPYVQESDTTLDVHQVRAR